MNYACKVSLAIPFAAAASGLIAAGEAKASILACVLAAGGGFVLGACIGALCVGLSNVLLSFSDRYTGPGCTVGLGVAYFVLPLVGVGAACIAAAVGTRMLL